MKSLLEKLIETDPDLWVEFCDTESRLLGCEGINYFTEIDGMEFDLNDDATMMLIQGAIQYECKRLKWHHGVTYNEETEKYVALVVPPGNETWLDDVEADTAAKAILIAYINAKESLK